MDRPTSPPRSHLRRGGRAGRRPEGDPRSSGRVEGLERIQQFLTSRHMLAAASPQLSDQIRSNLDMGESEALSLALEEPSILLTDDLAARAEAVRLGVRVSGTIGILIEARNRGVLVAVLPLLLELRKRVQWLSDQLIEMVRATEPQA